MKSNDELTLRQETVRDCPILYQMMHCSMQETCMCWGFECGDGWMQNIYDASCQLESLNNIFYPKFRVRIQADQVKEKFGTLHFYYSVVADPSAIETWLKAVCKKLSNKLFNAEFKMKKVTDIEPYDYDETSTISKEEYKHDLEFKCSNVEHKIEDGKITRIVHLRNYGKCHYVPTKSKFRYWLAKKLKSLAWSDGITFKCNAKFRAAMKYLDVRASEIIEKAEKACESTCEDCGKTIGTSWSPLCTTASWITYVCEDCAKKHKTDYYKDKCLYNDGKLLKTEEELKKHIAEVEAEHEKKEQLRQAEIEEKMKELENEDEK